MMMVVVVEHKCERGTVYRIVGMGGGKARILRGEEDGSMPHIYI
jgi:hypothetical protein